MRIIHFEVWDKHPGKGRKKQIVEMIEREFEEVEGAFPDAGKLYKELMIRYNGGFLMYNLGKARYDICFGEKTPSSNLPRGPREVKRVDSM